MKYGDLKYMYLLIAEIAIIKSTTSKFNYKIGIVNFIKGSARETKPIF